MNKRMGLIVGCNFMPDDRLVGRLMSSVVEEGQDIENIAFHAVNVHLDTMDIERARAFYFRFQKEMHWPAADRLSCQTGRSEGKELWIVYPA